MKKVYDRENEDDIQNQHQKVQMKPRGKIVFVTLATIVIFEHITTSYPFLNAEIFLENRGLIIKYQHRVLYFYFVVVAAC